VPRLPPALGLPSRADQALPRSVTPRAPQALPCPAGVTVPRTREQAELEHAAAASRRHGRQWPLVGGSATRIRKIHVEPRFEDTKIVWTKNICPLFHTSDIAIARPPLTATAYNYSSARTFLAASVPRYSCIAYSAREFPAWHAAWLVDSGVIIAFANEIDPAGERAALRPQRARYTGRSGERSLFPPTPPLVRLRRTIGDRRWRGSQRGGRAPVRARARACVALAQSSVLASLALLRGAGAPVHLML